MKRLELHLPMPPSVNGLYRDRKGAKGRTKSKAYKAWISEAAMMVRNQATTRFEGDVSLRFYFGPRNRRADLFNFVKAPEDLLVSQGIIEDDRFVTKGTVVWSEDVVGCIVIIEQH